MREHIIEKVRPLRDRGGGQPNGPAYARVWYYVRHLSENS
jgi:hypothetical protein